MKKVLLFFGWMLLFTSSAKAQVPQGIPYQAVARNGQGQPLASTNVKVRFSILDSTATGTAVYVESHSTTTSALGLFTANVGMGTSSTGTFSSINWGQNFKFLKVELDTTATGNSYIDLGTQQMMSVPYALYAGGINNQTNQIDQNYFTMIANSQSSNSNFWVSLNYCYSLVESGYTDWRLPSLEEVEKYVEVNGIPLNGFTTWTTTNGSPVAKIVVTLNNTSFSNPNNFNLNSHFELWNNLAQAPAHCVR